MNPEKAVGDAKGDSWEIYAIGIGDVEEEYLRTLASDDEHAIYLENFDDLDSLTVSEAKRCSWSVSRDGFFESVAPDECFEDSRHFVIERKCCEDEGCVGFSFDPDARRGCIKKDNDGGFKTSALFQGAEKAAPCGFIEQVNGFFTNTSTNGDRYDGRSDDCFRSTRLREALEMCCDNHRCDAVTYDRSEKRGCFESEDFSYHESTQYDGYVKKSCDWEYSDDGYWTEADPYFLNECFVNLSLHEAQEECCSSLCWSFSFDRDTGSGCYMSGLSDRRRFESSHEFGGYKLK